MTTYLFREKKRTKNPALFQDHRLRKTSFLPYENIPFTKDKPKFPANLPGLRVSMRSSTRSSTVKGTKSLFLIRNLKYHVSSTVKGTKSSLFLIRNLKHHRNLLESSDQCVQLNVMGVKLVTHDQVPVPLPEYRHPPHAGSCSIDQCWALMQWQTIPRWRKLLLLCSKTWTWSLPRLLSDGEETEE